jgi:hypothetical protein
MQPLRCFVLCTALAAIGAQAAPTDTYRIGNAVIAGGGATLGGGSYRLSGTLGQAATARLADAPFGLYDGFWSPQPATGDSIFANGFDP